MKNRYELSRALADVFRAEIAGARDAGCKHVQLEDLGAWMPHLSGEKDFDWVSETVDRTMADMPRARRVALLHGQRVGQQARGQSAAAIARSLPHYHGVKVDAFVLDFACREMEDADLLRKLPSDKTVASA